jgi:hypothetical protein
MDMSKQLVIKFFDCNGVYSEIVLKDWETLILFTPNGKIFIPFEKYKREFSNEIEENMIENIKEFIEIFFFKENVENDLEIVELKDFIESLELTKELYGYDLIANSIEPLIIKTDLVNECENFEVLKVEYI